MQISNSSFKGLLPFLILAVLSFKIHRSMKKLKERLTKNTKYDRDVLGRNLIVMISSSRTRGANNGSLLEVQTAEEKRLAYTRAGSQYGGSLAQTTSRELNLAVILIFTTTTFFVLHTPRYSVTSIAPITSVYISRVITGFYEAIFIQSSLDCRLKGKEYFHPLTYMSLNAVIIFLQVQHSNISNSPIGMFRL